MHPTSRRIAAVVIAIAALVATFNVRAAPLGQWSAPSSLVFDLVNQQRDYSGLAPLLADSRLHSAALAHSNDMLATANFDHIGSDGSTIAGRARRAGYDFSFGGVGENIFNFGRNREPSDVGVSRLVMYGTEDLGRAQRFAAANGLPGIDDWSDVGDGWSDADWAAWGGDSGGNLGGWMGSPSHRPSILNARFTDLGVGFAAGDNIDPVARTTPT